VFRMPPLTPFVRVLLIALFGAFIAAALLENFLGVPVVRHLALNPLSISPLTALQVVTYPLVVPTRDLFPLLISLLFLWLILAPFEERYGLGRTVQLALAATLAAALSALAVGRLLPEMVAGSMAGPQWITLAAVSAYAVLLPPYAEVNFFGVFPMRAKYLLGLVVGFSVLGFITHPDAAALGADLGAIGSALGFVKWWMQKPPPRSGGGQKRKGGPSLRLVKEGDAPKRWVH
jgi:membrane associated rhomboid family serine protease